MSIYDFSAKTIEGENKSLKDYKGKVLLIVNTASECGFTPQFEGLQNLYSAYHDQEFEILGFPCNQFKHQEPGTNEQIASFCEDNYGVSFQMFNKVEVKGDDAHPLFTYLTEEAKGLLTKEIKWNFTKFLINKQGEVINRFAPQTEPKSLEKDIKKALSE
jgi:glutathione peroxidase